MHTLIFVMHNCTNIFLNSCSSFLTEYVIMVDFIIVILFHICIARFALGIFYCLGMFPIGLGKIVDLVKSNYIIVPMFVGRKTLKNCIMRMYEILGNKPFSNESTKLQLSDMLQYLKFTIK